MVTCTSMLLEEFAARYAEYQFCDHGLPDLILVLLDELAVASLAFRFVGNSSEA